MILWDCQVENTALLLTFCSLSKSDSFIKFENDFNVTCPLVFVFDIKLGWITANKATHIELLLLFKGISHVSIVQNLSWHCIQPAPYICSVRVVHAGKEHYSAYILLQCYESMLNISWIKLTPGIIPSSCFWVRFFAPILIICFTTYPEVWKLLES